MSSRIIRVESLCYNYSASEYRSMHPLFRRHEVECFIDMTYLQLIGQAIGYEFNVFRLAPTNEKYQTKTLIPALSNGVIDMAINGIVLGENLANQHNCSFPYSVKDLTFMTPAPLPLSRKNSMLYPFDLPTWIGLAVSLVVMSLITKVCCGKGTSLSQIIVKVCSAVLKQPLNMKRWTWPCSGCWLMCSQMLTFFYTAVLLSFLTNPGYEKGIETVKDLALVVEEGKYSAATCDMDTDNVQEFFLATEEKYTKSLGEIMSKNDWFSPRAFGMHVYSKDTSIKRAFVGERDKLKTYIDSFLDNYVFSRDTFKSIYFTIPMVSSFCCRKKLDTAIHRLWAAGLYNALEDRAMRALGLTEKREEPVQSEQILSLDDLYVAFVIYAIGMGIATITFLCEVICYKLRKKEGCCKRSSTKA